MKILQFGFPFAVEGITLPTNIAVKEAFDNLDKIGEVLLELELLAGGAARKGASCGAGAATATASSRPRVYFCFELNIFNGIKRWKVCYLPSRQDVGKWAEDCNTNAITTDCVTIDAELLRRLCAA